MSDNEGGGFLDSLKGMLVGLALVPISFVPVYYASQRSQASEKLAEALPVARQADAATAGKAVYATGKIKAAPIGDSPFVKPGNYISLHRSGEVYTYIQTSRTEGEGDKKKKVYSCKLGWTSNPSDSGWQASPGCRGKLLRTVTNEDRSVGARVSLEADGTTYQTGEGLKFYGFPGISLSQSDVLSGSLSGDDTIYPDPGCASSPYNGCQRVEYSGSSYDPAADATVVGSAQSGKFSEFKTHLIMGVGDYATTMKTVNADDAKNTVLLFLVAVAMFGGGLVLLVGPLLKLIEYIPLIGGFGAGLIRFIFFAFAFVFMGITFLLIEYWYLVLILLAVIVIAVVVIARNRRAAAAGA